MLLRSDGHIERAAIPAVRSDVRVVKLQLPESFVDVNYQEGPVWQSNGGPYRGHAARAYPFNLDIDFGQLPSALKRVHILGVFALYASREDEAIGTIGASIHFIRERQMLSHHQLVNGRHYADGFDLNPRSIVHGDGSSVQTVGVVKVADREYRLDLFTLDVPEEINPTSLRFKDLASNSSFVVLGVFLEALMPAGCPFRGKSGRIALSEIPAIVRVGDRVKFHRALMQLEEGLQSAEDLDEARSQSLTFLAMVTATMLEVGGSRAMHRVQLEIARELEGMTTRKSRDFRHIYSEG